MKTLAAALSFLVLSVPGLALAETTKPVPASPGPSDVPASSVEARPDPYRPRASVMAGLSQWTLWGGGNLAAQVKVGRVAFEVSHGQALDFTRVSALGLTSDERSEGVSVRMPWTTGGGVGFQITPNLHVLVEVKAHRYEITGATGQDTLRYTSFTVGPGVFYDIYLWKGLFVQPNLRWWPTVASTYDDKGTLARADGTRYRPERHDLLPFVNVNVGWTFGQ